MHIDLTTCQTRQDVKTIAQLSELKPIMLTSSVQAVVACNATAQRVCTLVLFIAHALDCITWHWLLRYMQAMAE